MAFLTDVPEPDAAIAEDELSLFELHEKLQSIDKDITKNPETLDLVATWDAEQELHTITCTAFRTFVGKNQMSRESLVKSLDDLRKYVSVAFKPQNGYSYQYNFPARKTWKGCLNDFRKEAGIPTLEGYQIMHDGENVAQSGVKWKAGERFEIDVMQHQSGG